ncbi:dTMP kinase [Mobilicoccus massiliensis]|uniref:dTMP kinase n=1 Tax=Mobilicoccus massiliensis TaxID=1522310 RepID=UPI0009E403A6|nr:dTMP kinase [Mobilicoccus massiliensis]
MVFIAFEGGDGAGKSTQVEALVTSLRARGRAVVVTREPGGTPLGGRIRELLLHGDAIAPRAEALLFAADRAQHVETLIRPALERGEVVVTDRYVDSSIAYQGAGRDLDAEQIAGLSRWATGGLVPDLTVLLDVSPRTGLERRSGRAADRMETEAEDFHTRVREHFLDLAAADPARYLVLDAAAPRDELARAVAERVGALLATEAAPRVGDRDAAPHARPTAEAGDATTPDGEVR